MSIPVVDLFAGPGGLGEGFSSLRCGDQPAFKIRLSIEKDYFAHRTLLLRAFYRQFPLGEAPETFYSHLRGHLSREDLFKAFRSEAEAATTEAWCAELGSPDILDSAVDDRIRNALAGRKTWVLIGGPPCQAYSIVGRSRRRHDPEFRQDARHFLYREYLRILAEHQPPVFLMENVKGLLSATVDEQSMFERILCDLSDPGSAVDGYAARNCSGYDLLPLVAPSEDLSSDVAPEDFVVHAEDFGIPQARHRIFLLGVRKGLRGAPGFLKKSEKKVCVRDIIGDLPPVRSGLSREKDGNDAWFDAVTSIASAAWTRQASMDCEVLERMRPRLSGVRNDLSRGGEFVSGSASPAVLGDWYGDVRLGGFCNHATRSHIREDLHRYWFAAVYSEVHGVSPRLVNFPVGLLPRHKNVANALNGELFADRFRVQLAERPATTVVSHIAKDGHYFIHYDPMQCRSLTVREAARIQTFPDNYCFVGPRTEQYRQVGNAVPPLLARQIAEVVRDFLV